MRTLLFAVLVAFSSFSYAHGYVEHKSKCQLGWPVMYYQTTFAPYTYDSQFGRPASYYRYTNCLIPRGFYPDNRYPTFHQGRKHHHAGFCRYINKEGLSIEIYCQK